MFEDFDEQEIKEWKHSSGGQHFIIHRERHHGFVSITDTKGKKVEGLEGRFTTLDLAKKAIDQYVNNIELKVARLNKEREMHLAKQELFEEEVKDEATPVVGKKRGRPAKKKE